MNLEGLEAAAATNMTFDLDSGRVHNSSAPMFNADHPILFLIGDSKSRLILFAGRMQHPSQV
ncbi:serpin family protein [Roseimaritima ulvae]|uniref:serpin family protein n=1 Tax=Roseimaritima ulvae TaxID=980254 RepID=UPI00138FC771